MCRFSLFYVFSKFCFFHIGFIYHLSQLVAMIEGLGGCVQEAPRHVLTVTEPAV